MSFAEIVCLLAEADVRARRYLCSSCGGLDCTNHCCHDWVYASPKTIYRQPWILREADAWWPKPPPDKPKAWRWFHAFSRPAPPPAVVRSAPPTPPERGQSRGSAAQARVWKRRRFVQALRSSP